MSSALALIREIIEGSGGTIALETVEGEFAELVVTLPRVGGAG